LPDINLCALFVAVEILHGQDTAVKVLLLILNSSCCGIEFCSHTNGWINDNGGSPMPDTSQLITQFNSIDFSVIPPGEFICPPHLHHFHQLDIILGGRVTVCIEGEIKARRGTAVLIPPLCRHSYFARGGFRQISFKFHLSPQYWAYFGGKHCSLQLPEYRLSELENCGRHCEAQTPLAHQYAIAAITLCLISLAEAASPAPAVTHDNALLSQLWQLLENIEMRPYDSWAVGALARSCHLSPDHFSRSFHRLLGTAPQRYLMEARMRAAAADLLDDVPIKQISENAGYATVHAFSRAFKGVFGISPAAYRRAPRRF
jgi:AraC-like DNA-binding protein